MSQIIMQTATHQIRTADGAVVGPGPIRRITTQAFYRRMTIAERRALRASITDEVKDLLDDLARLPAIDLDGSIEQQLIDTNEFTVRRVDELLVDGTAEERALG